MQMVEESSQMNIYQLKETNPTEGWQSEWPVELNTLWWFFGHRDIHHATKLQLSPHLLLVEVKGTANTPVYIAEGHFLYKAQAEGVFLKCIPPVPMNF